MLVPEPGVLAASIRPPWASTMALQIASPSPAWPSAPERAEALEHLRELASQGDLTLLTATKRADISEATVLAEELGG